MTREELLRAGGMSSGAATIVAFGADVRQSVTDARDGIANAGREGLARFDTLMEQWTWILALVAIIAIALAAKAILG
jgi:hypothetical protein